MDWPQRQLARAACAADRAAAAIPHPGSNFVGGRRWTDAEADQKIAETIEYHRNRNIGFQWWVSPFDTPSDLRARLEKTGHGPGRRRGHDGAAGVGRSGYSRQP